MAPATGMTDPLYAMGLILFSDQAPIALCAIDWCEISNQSHVLWRKKLAAAVGTTPERVAVQCMHPHCTPWPDEEAQELVSQQPGLRHVMDVSWCGQALERVAQVAQKAVKQRQPFTHLGYGQAKVEKVASNRRIYGPDGKVKAIRWTVTKDPAVRAEPEGLIDPWLKTISFWNNNQKLVSLHYYAVHDTSYDNSVITNDFTGLARERLAAETGEMHLYFTGCAGNITAGKYNDGAPENRSVLTERIYKAMVDSEKQIERIFLSKLDWRVDPVIFPPRKDFDESTLFDILRDSNIRDSRRIQAALQLAYRNRRNEPIPLTCLEFNDQVSILHLPGESFIEYQLFSQQQRPECFVAVASYGDCGPGYICMEQSFEEGGYEPEDSFVAGESEKIMKETIARLVTGKAVYVTL